MKMAEFIKMECTFLFISIQSFCALSQNLKHYSNQLSLNFFPHNLSTLQKAALENTLAETEARYSSMLASFQNQINNLESELAQVRASIEQQGRDYKMLLDIKSRLEQEIATYRSLLEKEESR